jgi:membrane-associated phospholipid phosphatase
LFGGTLSDIRRLPSKQSLMWVGIGLLGAQASHPSDRGFSTTMFKSDVAEDTLKFGSNMGGARGQLGGSLATYAIGRLSHNDRIADLGGELFRAQIITQGITQGIKMSVRRARPDGTQYSFPSGHTSTSFASATVLQREFGWKVGIPAYAVASYVAAARVQEKRHYLSDVAFGAALGILVGRTVTVGHGDRQFAVGPLATPGGAGVQFTLIDKK